MEFELHEQFALDYFFHDAKINSVNDFLPFDCVNPTFISTQNIIRVDEIHE